MNDDLEFYKSPENSTIDNKTKVAYEKKAKQLKLKAIKDLSVNDIDDRQFVMWLIDNRGNFSKNTYRLYKSSIIYYLTNIIDTEVSNQAAEYLIKINSDISYKKSNKTSSRKTKSISEKDLEKLLSYLDSNNNKWNQYIKYWLLSGILCGLRPIEWCNAEIIKHNNQNALKVKNAKNTNGRANGDYRILLLSNLKHDEIDIIKKQIYNVKLFYEIGEYERFYNDCVVQLNNVNKILFGNRKKNITLYSARHQFSANAKYSDKSKEEVAALMGHAVDSTATLHYGKKRSGKNIIGVQPIEEQVNSVKKQKNNFYDSKNYNKLNKE